MQEVFSFPILYYYLAVSLLILISLSINIHNFPVFAISLFHYHHLTIRFRKGGSTSFEGYIQNGPWGGLEGKDWIYMPNGFIKNITIIYGDVIDSIVFQNYSGVNELKTSFFGGNGGDQTETISIDYPNEYLISISGTIYNFHGSNVVRSLSFETNLERYGPFGAELGTHFSYEGKGGVIVGFHGLADEYLNAIGVYVMPKSLILEYQSTWESNSSDEVHSLVSKSLRSRMSMPREAGPWGDCGGKEWDDGVFSIVKQVHVHYGESLNVVHALEFVYVKRDGKSVLSKFHGGTNGEKREVVSFDGTNEYLTGVSGFYGPVEGYNRIRAIVSITFYTNKMVYGPYGRECGAEYIPFTSTSSPGKVVGFHGRSSGFLRAVGVHMEFFEDGERHLT